MTLTVYSNSYSIDTMTHSTLTSFHTSRQPSRQLSEQPISARLSPVPEPSPSQVFESNIDHNKAIDLVLPSCQQGSPPNPNNTSNSSLNASWQGQPYSANLEKPAYLVNPPSNPAAPPANPASLPGTPPTIPANLLANPDNSPANIPANQANDLAQALTMLAGSI